MICSFNDRVQIHRISGKNEEVMREMCTSYISITSREFKEAKYQKKNGESE
jgi:hypothetical protein